MDALVIGCSQTWALLWFWERCSSNRMQPNMNIMVWAWVLVSSDAAEHEHAYGLGMDALVIGCSQTRTCLWFGHGCSGHRMQSDTNMLMVWAWMLWSSDAVRHEHAYGLGMDALVIRCFQKRAEKCFGHGCPGHRMQSSMNDIITRGVVALRCL